MRFTRLFSLAAVCFTAHLCWASEVIELKNHFSIEAESHVSRGEIVECKVGAGTMEFRASEINSIAVVPDAPQAKLDRFIQKAEMRPEILLSSTAAALGMDEAFVRSVAQIESGLRQSSISKKGAVGLMQLMPATAKELGVDASRAEQNIRGGVQYLRSLLLQYKGDSALALAAYNAGPGAVQKYKGVPPFSETRHYVLAVLKEYSRQLSRASKPTAIN